MPFWMHENTVETRAAAADIWALWSRPLTWPVWDAGIQYARIEGDFSVGNTGVLKPLAGPQVKFVLLEVVPSVRFVSRSLLPLTTLEFTHTYTSGGAGKPAMITHRIEMSGLLTPLFRRIIGKSIQKDLPHAMEKLARMAEASAAAL